MDNNLDWDLPAPTGEEAILDPYANTVFAAPLPEAEAKTRALKIKVAFSGEESAPSYEEILSEVQTQREDRLKGRLAQSEAIRKSHLKQNLIRDIVNSGEATPDSLTFLQGLSADEIIDEEGILEKKYAEWRVAMGLSADESGTVEKVLTEKPEFGDEVDASIDRIYRKELASAARARAQAKYDQTGIGRTLIDFGFSILPWAEAQEAKNITPDNVNAEGILPSTVRRSQVRDLYAMSPKEFEASILQMEKEADESGDWKPFIQLMQDLDDYSAYRGQVDNAFALVSLVELAPGGVVFDAVKGVGSLGRAGGRAVARSEARRKAQEAVSGAVSNPPTGQGAKAAGEAPKAPAEAQATATQKATEANAAAGRGQTTVTVDGQTATAGEAPEPPFSQEEIVVTAVAEKVEEVHSGFQFTPTDWTDEPFEVKEVGSAEMPAVRGKKGGIAAIIYGEAKKGQPHQSSINTEKLQEAFDKKVWLGKDGFLPDGARAFPEDAFQSVDEFKDFLIQHELAHIDVGRQKGRALASQEDEVTREALARIGRKDLLRKMYPEIFARNKAPGPDPDVVPAPPKVAEVVSKPKSYPTPQTIDVPGTQKKYKDLKAKIKRLNEEIRKTYPKGSTTSAGIPDKGERRLALQVELGKAQEELAKITSIIDNKEYQALVKFREETAKKISAIADRLKFPAKHYPKWFKEGAQDTKAWQKEKTRLEKELKAEQKKFGQTDRLDLRPKAEVTPNTVSASDAVDEQGNRKVYSKANPPKKMAPDWRDPHVVVDLPNAATGGSTPVQVPATEENLARIYKSNVEGSSFGDLNDIPATIAAHGEIDNAAVAEAVERVTSEAAEKGKKTIEEASKALARKVPSMFDFVGAVTGRPQHASLQKLVNNLAKKYEDVIKRQGVVNEELWKAFNESQSLGALRWSKDVFEAVKDAAKAQMDRYVKSPSTAILDIGFKREWETIGRTNNIVYKLGRPDGNSFENIEHASLYAQEYYGLADGAFSVESINPNSFIVRVEKVIDETDPDILKHAIQTDTATPVSWVNTFMSYLRGSAGVSSETLQANLAVSSHHAKALHRAFMVAAADIGKLSKKESRFLDALMEAKRDVEKIVVDPVSGEEMVKRGEWFNTAAELENTYKKAFGEYPSENVVSAYFTMRQMYDFDLMYRNMKLYTEKTRIGIENAKLHIPVPDNRNPGMVKWVQQKKGVEAKFVEELPSGNHDVLILDPETAQAHYINTGKSGVEGIKALREKGYKIMQLANPDQRPLRNVNDNYIQFVVAKDVERTPLTPDQLPATEGGHVRYKEGFYVKQPRFETTSNGERLYLGDKSILGASSEAEARKHAANMEIARQLLVKGDTVALSDHLSKTLPWTVGEFEDLFKPRLGNTGEILEEPLLNKDTAITWVMDGQGVNDASKTHAQELRDAFLGVRDTIDDPNNIYGVIGKKYAGEKDLALKKIVDGDNGKIFNFDKARMISPMETLEQAWAEISRGVATDNMKIQAATNWVEEAAQALETPLEELRRNPWAALNNPQWNRQYGDLAKIRTLDAQRRQIIHFLGQRDSLGTSLDWMRNKLLNSVYERKGQAAADWVDDHVLPNVRNPLAFARSFAFHTKMGFFNPIQLFLQANTMINTWAITGSPVRVGSALSGVMLMQMSRVNRTPEILASLAKKSESLGWKPGEWVEMEDLFRKLSLDTVEGEVGTLDVMTNPKLFKGAGGIFLDKGLVFFREAERAIRANAWAVAYKEFRDKFPKKVLNNADINSILRRQEILSANMTRGSNALWQKGLTGPMTQFWGYQARITEQLLGKQLTRAEKLRLGTAFAAMYGMPVSLAAATMFQIPGWSTDDLRQYALENGIDTSSGLASVAMNGLPAELIRWMTSDENGQGGVLLAIGDRYGPGGLPVIRNLIEARDGTADALVDLIFGASGSITRDFFKHILPDDWDILESAANPPKLVLSDFANMFSTISTVNNSTKLYWALTTHKNMTRDGLNLGDKSAVSAWVSFTTGLEEQRFKDTFLKLDSLQDLRTATDELGKEYVRQIRKAKLLPVGSEERLQRVRKARALLEGMDPKDVKKFVKQAYRSGDSLEKSIDRSFNDKIGKE